MGDREQSVKVVWMDFICGLKLVGQISLHLVSCPPHPFWVVLFIPVMITVPVVEQGTTWPMGNVILITPPLSRNYNVYHIPPSD
jgi:hypothetical protein